MEYKSIKYDHFPEHSTIMIEEYNGGNDTARILRASIYAELLGFAKPKALIIKNTGEEPILSPFFKKFLRTYIYKDALDYGVRNIIFILSDDEYQSAVLDQEKPPYVTYCLSVDEALAFLKDEKPEQVKNKKSPSAQ